MHGNNAVANKSGNLIVFAWGAELFGIALGVANSISLTFPKSLPENLFGWLPVLPVAILAAFELLRIPLAQAFQQAQQFMPRLLALIAMIALVGIALENWTLGLERTLNQRIHQAEQFRADHQDAQRAIAAREEANRRTKGALETEVLSARQELEVIETQIAAEHRRHVDNMERVKDCLKLVIVCYQAELNKENQRYDEAKKSLSQRRDGAGHRIATASASLVELGNGPIFGTDELRQMEEKAWKAFAVAANDNPIYRIASAVFRVSPTELTNEQISTTRGLFAFFGAVIVSLTGTLAALVHYWPSGRPSALQRAVRGYLLRMRRRVVRIEKVEVPVDRIVEKIVPEVEKPILIEKTLIKYIPYTGGGALPTDETHEKHIEGRPAAEALAAARASNTAHLRVYK